MNRAVEVMAQVLRGVDLNSHIAVFAALFDAGVPAEDISLYMRKAMKEAGKQLDRANAALGI